jgi:hypothetical protein
MIDSLLESIIILARDYNVLYDEYIDILQLIIRFADKVFELPATIVITLFLRKFKRVLEISSSQEKENL